MDTPTTGTTRAPAPGRLALVQQFVNTHDVMEAEDRIDALPALEGWLREHGLIEAGDGLDAGDLERALALREALRDLLDDHDRPSPDAIRTLNSVPREASLRVSFDATGAPRLEPAGRGLDRAFAALLAIVERAALDGTWERLKVCADDGCRWAFYDRSKNRSGSWCVMAVCGNRAKARSYRERRRPAPRAS